MDWGLFDALNAFVGGVEHVDGEQEMSAQAQHTFPALGLDDQNPIPLFDPSGDMFSGLPDFPESQSFPELTDEELAEINRWAESADFKVAPGFESGGVDAGNQIDAFARPTERSWDDQEQGTQPFGTMALPIDSTLLTTRAVAQPGSASPYNASQSLRTRMCQHSVNNHSLQPSPGSFRGGNQSFEQFQGLTNEQRLPAVLRGNEVRSSRRSEAAEFLVTTVRPTIDAERPQSYRQIIPADDGRSEALHHSPQVSQARGLDRLRVDITAQGEVGGSSQIRPRHTLSPDLDRSNSDSQEPANRSAAPKTPAQLFIERLERLVDDLEDGDARKILERAHDRTWSSPEDDNTIPKDDRAAKQYVKQLLTSMASTHNAIESKGKDNSYGRRWSGMPADPFYSVEKMALRCWDIVKKTIKLHKEGPSALGCYDQDFSKKIAATASWTFADRINSIAKLLETSKRRCDAAIKNESVTSLIGAPGELVRVSAQNMKANLGKRAKIERGNQALKEDKAAKPQNSLDAGNGVDNNTDNVLDNSGAQDQRSTKPSGNQTVGGVPPQAQQHAGVLHTPSGNSFTQQRRQAPGPRKPLLNASSQVRARSGIARTPLDSRSSGSNATLQRHRRPPLLRAQAQPTATPLSSVGRKRERTVDMDAGVPPPSPPKRTRTAEYFYASGQPTFAQPKYFNSTGQPAFATPAYGHSSAQGRLSISGVEAPIASLHHQVPNNTSSTVEQQNGTRHGANSLASNISHQEVPVTRAPAATAQAPSRRACPSDKHHDQTSANQTATTSKPEIAPASSRKLPPSPKRHAETTLEKAGSPKRARSEEL